MAVDEYNYETQRTPASWRSDSSVTYDRNARATQGIPRLLAEMDRAIELLGEAIETEEIATRVSDKTDLRYSLSAKAMHARRENLVKTRLALVDRLENFDMPKPSGRINA